MLKFFKRIAYFIPRWFNFFKQKKLIFNFFVNRNWKKLTDSRKRAQILADNRKSHHPIETLTQATWVLQPSQEKLKAMLMQNFGLTNKEHYGMLWYFL